MAPQEMRGTRNTQPPGLRFRALLTGGADPIVQSGHLGLTSIVVASSFPKGRSLRASYAIYQSAWKGFLGSRCEACCQETDFPRGRMMPVSVGRNRGVLSEQGDSDGTVRQHN